MEKIIYITIDGSSEKKYYKETIYPRLKKDLSLDDDIDEKSKDFTIGSGANNNIVLHNDNTVYEEHISLFINEDNNIDYELHDKQSKLIKREDNNIIIWIGLNKLTITTELMSSPKMFVLPENFYDKLTTPFEQYHHHNVFNFFINSCLVLLLLSTSIILFYYSSDTPFLISYTLNTLVSPIFDFLIVTLMLYIYHNKILTKTFLPVMFYYYNSFFRNYIISLIVVNIVIYILSFYFPNFTINLYTVCWLILTSNLLINVININLFSQKEKSLFKLLVFCFLILWALSKVVVFTYDNANNWFPYLNKESIENKEFNKELDQYFIHR